MSVDEIMLNRIWIQRDDLLKENKRLEDRIKRLEQLGDALAYAIEESCDPTFANDVTRWRKNREAME